MKVKLLSFGEAVNVCRKRGLPYKRYGYEPHAYGIYKDWEHWGKVVDVSKKDEIFIDRMIIFDNYGIPSWLYTVIDGESNG